VLLAAPTAPDERLPRVVARARGFVYAVGLLGVTGERDALAASSLVIGSALMRRVLEGAGPVGAGAFVAEVRAALDAS
jgi:tryptophan synthase alpha chain